MSNCDTSMQPDGTSGETRSLHDNALAAPLLETRSNNRNCKKPKIGDLENYMFEKKFTGENFLDCVIDRASQAALSIRRVYVIFVNTMGMPQIVLVTQNNKLQSKGFPGGRIRIDLSKCPRNNGGKHQMHENLRKCGACGCVNLGFSNANKEDRHFIWDETKKWVSENAIEINEFCAESETEAAVRIFRNETGITGLTEDILNNSSQIIIGSARFYVCVGTFASNKSTKPKSKNILSVNHFRFAEIEAMSSNGQLSNIHAAAFTHYLKTPL